MTRFLVDSNVLVYRLDARAPAKRGQAHQLLLDLQPTGAADLSAQVLGEFFRVVTARLDPPVPVTDAVRLVRQLVQSFRVWPIDERVVLEAVRGVRDHHLAYWDSQLWATAKIHGCGAVLSEDFTDGRDIEGVKFHDPFAAHFSLPTLLSGSD